MVSLMTLFMLVLMRESNDLCHESGGGCRKD